MKRVYKDVPPQAVVIMSQWLAEAFGGAGGHLAKLEQRDRQQRENERQELHSDDPDLLMEQVQRSSRHADRSNAIYQKKETLMGWHIKCFNAACGKLSWAPNVVSLLNDFIANSHSGLFICSHCQQCTGYVEKNFELQEKGEYWKPFLRGGIKLAGDAAETYQPFVFLVSDEKNGPITSCWFSYYKDLRSSGGILKMGYGPGGPPVLGHNQTIDLIASLLRLGFVQKSEILRLVT